MPRHDVRHDDGRFRRAGAPAPTPPPVGAPPPVTDPVVGTRPSFIVTLATDTAEPLLWQLANTDGGSGRTAALQMLRQRGVTVRHCDRCRRFVGGVHRCPALARHDLLGEQALRAQRPALVEAMNTQVAPEDYTFARAMFVHEGQFMPLTALAAEFMPTANDEADRVLSDYLLHAGCGQDDVDVLRHSPEFQRCRQELAEAYALKYTADALDGRGAQWRVGPMEVAVLSGEQVTVVQVPASEYARALDEGAEVRLSGSQHRWGVDGCLEPGTDVSFVPDPSRDWVVPLRRDTSGTRCFFDADGDMVSVP